MKNKTIKKALAIGMSVLMLASTFTPISVQGSRWLETEQNRLVVGGG